jgi:hypothetical protein
VSPNVPRVQGAVPEGLTVRTLRPRSRSQRVMSLAHSR